MFPVSDLLTNVSPHLFSL